MTSYLPNFCTYLNCSSNYLQIENVRFISNSTLYLVAFVLAHVYMFYIDVKYSKIAYIYFLYDVILIFFLIFITWSYSLAFCTYLFTFILLVLPSNIWKWMVVLIWILSPNFRNVTVTFFSNYEKLPANFLKMGIFMYKKILNLLWNFQIAILISFLIFLILTNRWKLS